MELLDRLTDRLDAELARLAPSSRRDGLLLAVSGGPDSTALALAAARLQRRAPEPGRLVVGYVDHRLGRESRRAARVVAETARALGLEACERAVARPGAGLSEERLRRLRYEALAEIARAEGLRWILTAHHRDDDLEGVLMRLRRGAGPRGLSGMPARRPLEPGIWLVRPFLGAPGEVLRRAAAASGLPIRHDPANLDLSRTRNRTRHLLLPRLRAVLGRAFEGHLDELLRAARSAHAALDEAARRLLRRRGRRPAPWRFELRLTAAEARRWRPALLEAVRLVHERLRPGEPAPWIWTERVVGLCHAPTAARVHGPRDLLAERTRDGLLVVDPDRAGRVLPRTAPLDGVGRRLGDSEWFLAVRASTERTPGPTPRSRWVAHLDAERVRLPLRVRPPRTGDRFHPLGAARDVELRRFLQGRRVARWDRDRLPLVVDADDRIVWVCGVEVCEFCRVTERTERRLTLETRCGIAGAPPDARPYFCGMAGSPLAADPQTHRTQDGRADRREWSPQGGATPAS